MSACRINAGQRLRQAFKAWSTAYVAGGFNEKYLFLSIRRTKALSVF
jgi:hypothetical protein